MRLVRLAPHVALAIVAIMLLPNINSALQIDENVDVNQLPYEHTFTNYALAKLHFIGVQEAITVGVTFEDADFDFMLFLGGKNIGTVYKERTMMFIINLYTNTDLVFQASNGLKVSVEQCGPNITVTENNITVLGSLGKEGNLYTTNIHVPHDNAHNVTVDATVNFTYLGICDGSISNFGYATSESEFHIHSADQTQMVRLIAEESGTFDIVFEFSSDNKLGIGGPSIGNVTFLATGADITMHHTELAQYSDEDSLAEEISIGDINYSFSTEDIDDDGCPKITLFRTNLKIQGGFPVITINEITDPPNKKTVYRRYSTIMSNEETVTKGDPMDLDPFVTETIVNPVAHIVYNVEVIDDDKDGKPIVILHQYNLTINSTGHPIQGGSYKEYHNLDVDDQDPSKPNSYSDLDGDGLSNYYEIYRTGTNPQLADTDNDGLSDYQEMGFSGYAAALNDVDLDGLNDSLELILGLNPLDLDTDDDYFEDGAELDYWLYREFGFVNATAKYELNNLTKNTGAIPSWALPDWDNDGVIDYLDKNSDDELIGAFSRPQRMHTYNHTLDLTKRTIIQGYRDLIASGLSPIVYNHNTSMISASRKNYTSDDDDTIDWLLDLEESYRSDLLNYSGNWNLTNQTRNWYFKEYEDSWFLAFYAYHQLIEETYFSDYGFYKDLCSWFDEDHNATGYYHQTPSYHDVYDTYLHLRSIVEDYYVAANVTTDMFMCKYYDLDGIELIFYHTDPADNDTDNDSLDDGIEVNYWKNINIDPFDDSDGDGIPNIYDADSDNDTYNDGIDFDLDNDGMEDVYEFFYGFDVESPGDASLDEDNDDLTNLEEFLNTTDPTKTDTDGDGIWDGSEVSIGLDPVNKDSDMDGIEDYKENSHSTDSDGDGLINALDTDSDNDGLTDSEEDKDCDGIVDTGETSPIDPDCDDDGFNDGYEVKNNHDPYSNATPDLDSDSDGLDNQEEYDYGTNPQTNDTDGDWILDKWEIDHRLDPCDANDTYLDWDGDGLHALGEYLNNTDIDHYDSDDDMMPDGWEVKYGLNPLSDDADSDKDSDNLTNIIEFSEGLDPSKADTDSDGMPDDWELSYLLNATFDDSGEDSDNDSLTNLQEYENGTDPKTLSWDTDELPNDWENSTGLNPYRNDTALDPDGDGLSNLLEYNQSTDPFDPDCDNDGLPDGWEYYNGLNASDSSDKYTDIDNDDLNNTEEYELGTKANSWDSDYDGMPDSWENDNSLIPTSFDAFEDYDGDGLENIEEYRYNISSTWNHSTDGVYEGGLDPMDPDYDNDGFTDGYEVKCNLTPTQLIPSDKTTDDDNDKLTNWEEYLMGTLANNNDSDMDGLEDYDEIQYQLVDIQYFTDNNGFVKTDGVNEIRRMDINRSVFEISAGNQVLMDFTVQTHGYYTLVVQMHTGVDPPVELWIKKNVTTISNRTRMVNQWKFKKYTTAITELSKGTYTLAVECKAETISLLNPVEIHLSSYGKPVLSDYDGDGLLDGKNVTVNNITGELDIQGNANTTTYLGEFFTVTNPMNIDTDGDGLTDGYNITIGNSNYLGELSFGTNPLKPDGDHDGLGDLEEVTLGYDGWITNPKNYDCDADGLYDGWNDKNGNRIFDPGETKGEWNWMTNPYNNDTDRDGVTDQIDRNPLHNSIITAKVKVNWIDSSEIDGMKFKVVIDDTGMSDDWKIKFTSVTLQPNDEFKVFYDLPDVNSTTTCELVIYETKNDADYRYDTKTHNIGTLLRSGKLDRTMEGETRYVNTSNFKIEYTFSDEDLNRINTLMFQGINDSYSWYHANYSTGQNLLRYVGDMGFYIFLLNVTGTPNVTGIVEGSNAWLVPRSLYFSSQLYHELNNTDDANNLSSPSDTDFYNNTCDLNSSHIMGVYSINLTASEAYYYYYNLTHNNSGNLTAESINITINLTHLGIYGDVLDMIPFDAPEVSEQGKIVKPKPKDKKSNSIWDKFTNFVSEVGAYVVENMPNFIKDTLIRAANAWNDFLVAAIDFFGKVASKLKEWCNPAFLCSVIGKIGSALVEIAKAALNVLNFIRLFFINLFVKGFRSWCVIPMYELSQTQGSNSITDTAKGISKLMIATTALILLTIPVLPIMFTTPSALANMIDISSLISATLSAKLSIAGLIGSWIMLGYALHVDKTGILIASYIVAIIDIIGNLILIFMAG